MGANSHKVKSKLRRIATKLLVTAIRNGYNSGPFLLQNNQVKLLDARTIRKAQECYCKLIFLNKFSWPFDEYNNNHSSQQGAGKFDICVSCRL